MATKKQTFLKLPFLFTTFLFLAFIPFSGISAQCSSPQAVVVTNIIENGDGTCNFSVDLTYNNSSGGGKSSMIVDISLSDGTVLISGDCIKNIVSPGGTKIYGPFSNYPCTEFITVDWVGKTNPHCGGSSCQTGSINTPPFTLPVELVSFEGKIQDDLVVLNWITASEEDNDYFSIEHSIDGINFFEIGKAEGHGTTEQMQSYSFIDKDALKGTNYYRLGQVDFGGEQFEYSKVISVVFNSELEKMLVYPSTVLDYVTLGIEQRATSDKRIDIISSLGVVLKSDLLSVGDSQKTIQVSGLDSGIYYLAVYDAQSRIVKPFIKIN